MEAQPPRKPPTFGECMAFAEVAATTNPGTTPSEHLGTKSYVSLWPAYVPALDLIGEQPIAEVPLGPPSNAFGGHVYAQSALVAIQAMEAAGNAEEAGVARKLGIHTIQGVFSAAGRADRPFVYEVTILSTGRTFRSCFVKARQPREPCETDQATGRFAPSNASGALGPVCFSCICTFKAPEPSSLSPQDVPPQQRFAAVLTSRPATAWPTSPPVDIDAIVAAFPHVDGGGGGSSSFPMLEMRKVDMASHNAGKPLHERRELILYRLLAPMDASRPGDHVALHAYESDRNGLLMAGNHAGLGRNFGKAASLSYAFYVHVDAEAAVMSFGHPEDKGVWWVQELEFPRLAAGRAALLSRIWSPEGVHVATGYQDGIMRAATAERL